MRLTPVIACAILLALAACGTPDGKDVQNRDEAQAKVNGAGDDFTLSGPYSHENLAIYLIHRKGVERDSAEYLTLDEGFAAQVVVVEEKGVEGAVPELLIENKSDRPLYVQAGEIVKGGKQDRTIARDFVIPPKSGKQPIAVFCVERGRWASRESDDRIDGEYVAKFGAVQSSLPSNELKLAVQKSKSQGEVWKMVEGTNAKAAEFGPDVANKSDSLALGAANENMQKLSEGYVKTLADTLKGNDVVGIAYAINGKMVAADAYASASLFRQLKEKSIRTIAMEAMIKKGKEPPPTPPTVEKATEFLNAVKASAAKEEQISEHVRLGERESEKVILFETKVRDAILHSSWGTIE